MELSLNAKPSTAGLDPDSLQPRNDPAMSHWLDEPRVRQDVVTIPRLWVTVALSMLIHVAVLFTCIPRTPLLTPGEQEENQLTDRLQVRLAAPPAPPPTPFAPQTQAPLPSPPRPPRPRARLRPPPA